MANKIDSIENEDHPVIGPETLFENRAIQVKDDKLIELTEGLVQKARGVLALLLIDGREHSRDGFLTDHNAVMAALDTVDGLLEQSEAVMQHTANTEEAVQYLKEAANA